MSVRPSWIPLLALTVGGLCLPGTAAALNNPWAEVNSPAAGTPQIIGGYTAGCIKGAESLLEDEGDFHLMRKSRQRYFVHPHMRRFIRDLAGYVREQGYGKLLVGDQAQARGGPSTTGHASHQTGLDGDFWFWLDSPATQRLLTSRDEEEISAVSMLNDTGTGVDPERFKAKHADLLKYAASKPGVERIFVHPRIKEVLCGQFDQASWLNKVRPWWGHHYHFHVRLGCPDGQKNCNPQEPPPMEAGCDSELEWWFKTMADAARRLPEEPVETPEQRLEKKLAMVPVACDAVLNGD